MNIVISRIVIALEVKFSVLVSASACSGSSLRKNKAARMEYFLCLFSINSVIKMAMIPLFDLQSFL